MAAPSKATSSAVKDIKQLDMKAQMINKEIDSQLYKRDPVLFSDMISMDKTLTSDLKTERIRTKKEVSKLRSMVSRFHQEIKNVKPTPQFLEKLKLVMEEIETNIRTFKDSQRADYEQLMAYELQHTHEINAMEKKFNSWNETDHHMEPVKKPVSKLPSARDVAKNLPPEVVQFEKFLAETGGMRGGWDEYDHNTFLKWRVRFKGLQRFLSEAVSHLPTKTPEEVASHETWYREFLSLQEQKKHAIRTWKSKKDEDKAEKLKDIESRDDESEDEQQKQHLLDKERRERLQRLSAWKLQKELERAEEKERKLREQKEKESREREAKIQQEELRQQVAEYKRQRQEEQEFLEMEEEARRLQQSERQKERNRINKERIDLRNHFAVEQKMKPVREAEKQKLKQQQREEKIRTQYQVSVARDPSRLLKPTERWRLRTKEVGASTESGRIYTMQHRAVPSWRAGL